MRRLWAAAANGSIILGITFTVLFVIDRFNPSMDFLGSEQSDWLLLALCLTSIVNGLISALWVAHRAALQKKRNDRRTHGSD